MNRFTACFTVSIDNRKNSFLPRKVLNDQAHRKKSPLEHFEKRSDFFPGPQRHNKSITADYKGRLLLKSVLSKRLEPLKYIKKYARIALLSWQGTTQRNEHNTARDARAAHDWRLKKKFSFFLSSAVHANPVSFLQKSVTFARSSWSSTTSLYNIMTCC